MLDGKLNVDQPYHAKRLGNLNGIRFNLFNDKITQVIRWQHGVWISRMNTSRFNMLHDADDVNIFTITNCICFGFYSIVQIMIEQYFVVRQMFPDVDDMFFEFLLVDYDFHALTTQYIRWPYQKRKTNLLRYFKRFVRIGGNAKFRIRYSLVF